MEFTSRIEEELKCPHCRRLYVHAVLLPCTHSLCLVCAHALSVRGRHVTPTGSSSPQITHIPSLTPLYTVELIDDGGAHTVTSHPDRSVGDCDVTGSAGDVEDKTSVASETDSGVDSTNSRPNSYIGTPSIGNLSIQSTGSQEAGSSLTGVAVACPGCRCPVYIGDDEHGGGGGPRALPRLIALDAIVERYREQKHQQLLCQICVDRVVLTNMTRVEPLSRVNNSTTGSREIEGQDVSKPATVMCEQCELYCCTDCQLTKHSIAEHTFMSVSDAVVRYPSKHKTEAGDRCLEHVDEELNLYCSVCRTVVCHVCIVKGQSHGDHETVTLGSVSKTRKVRYLDTRQSLCKIIIRHYSCSVIVIFVVVIGFRGRRDQGCF